MKNKKIIITLIILIIITLSIGTILIIKNNKQKLKEDEFYKHESVEVEEERIKEEQEEEEIEESEESTCAETIDGEFVGKYEGTPSEEVIITLNKDGIYEKKITEGEYQRGYYQIVKNNINFEFVPSVARSSAKTTYSYKISDDCSEITIRNSTFSYIAYRK